MLDTSQKLSEVLSSVLQENNLNKKMLEQQAAGMWHMIMGPTVNRATRNVFVSNGVMFVELESSVVRQEMLTLKKKIIERINELVGVGAITDIVFK